MCTQDPKFDTIVVTGLEPKGRSCKLCYSVQQKLGHNYVPYAECRRKIIIPIISISDCGKLKQTFGQAAGQPTTTGQVSSITTYLLLFDQIK